ncbi:MAG: S9 family peptidase [Roseiflexaceae bacterium]
MLQPPNAHIQPHATRVHGHTLNDDYFWLRERNNPAVKAYLNAENDYLNASIPQPLVQQLLSDLQSRIVADDDSASMRVGDHFYFMRYRDEFDYPQLMRAATSNPSDAQVVCDLQAEATGKSFLKLGGWKVSPDSQYIALLFDDSGNEHFRLHIRRINDGAELITPITNLYYGLAWSPNGEWLYLVRPDAAWRPSSVWAWQWQQPFDQAICLFDEPNPLCNVDLDQSGDGRHLIVGSHSSSSSEVWLYDTESNHTATCVSPRQQGVEYSVAVYGAQLFMHTNAQAVNFMIQTKTLREAGWRAIVPHRHDTTIEQIDAFANHLVAWVRRGGLQQVEIYTIAEGNMHTVQFNDAAYAITRGSIQQYKTNLLRVSYATPVTPATAFDYDMQTHTFVTIKQDSVGGRVHTPNDYILERVWATGHDGTEIPLTIVRHHTVVLDGTAPTLLIGYGSYGANLNIGFVPDRLALLEHGFVLAYAHIRGGGEMGREWYLNGKLLHKQNTFSDFISCAEYLIAQCYTSPAKLSIFGRSAGGLLMGAVVTQRPELFTAVIAGVPFVDVINTMLDATIPLTVPEYEEWGNPHDREYFDYMMRYSPYDNTVARSYPAIFMTAGFNDPRVQYWEPAKWIAKLRTLTPNGTYYLYTDMEAGHAGKSGRYDALIDRALEYAFLFTALDVSPRASYTTLV